MPPAWRAGLWWLNGPLAEAGLFRQTATRRTTPGRRRNDTPDGLPWRHETPRRRRNPAPKLEREACVALSYSFLVWARTETT